MFQLKNKQIWIIPIMTMLILVLLATAFYPAYNPKPKEVPMAIVNLDTGTQVQGKKINIGQNIEKKMTESDQKTFNWTTLKDKDVATQKVQNGTYAGAIVIEKDFSAHAFSPAQSLIMKDKTQETQEKVATGELPPQVIQQLQQQAPKPVKMSKAQINTYYNEGAQGQLGRVVKQALDQMKQGINTTISQQNRKALAQNHISIPADQLDAVIQPVKTQSKAYHPIKDNQANGNASMVLFMPVWLASMITAVLLYFNYKRNKISEHAHSRLALASLTVLIDLYASLIGGFAYVYFLYGVLHFDFPNPFVTALFVSLAVAGFSLLILGCMVWVGILIAPLFLLFVFFSMQAVMLPYAMVPKFYQQYILPWNPFKYYTREIAHLIYINPSLSWNTSIFIFIAFILFGAFSIFMAYTFKKFKS